MCTFSASVSVGLWPAMVQLPPPHLPSTEDVNVKSICNKLADNEAVFVVLNRYESSGGNGFHYSAFFLLLGGLFLSFNHFVICSGPLQNAIGANRFLCV